MSSAEFERSVQRMKLEASLLLLVAVAMSSALVPVPQGVKASPASQSLGLPESSESELPKRYVAVMPWPYPTLSPTTLAIYMSISS